MAAIADLSDLINRMTGGASGTPENIWFNKNSRRAGVAATAPVGGRWTSLWTYDGQPSAGAVPTTVAVPDNTMAGGLRQTDPGGGREKWLVGGGVSGLNQGIVLLYDRLLHIGGLNGTTTTAQNVGGTLTRYTDGIGNMMAIEIYTIIGASTTGIVANYDDEGGNPATTPEIVIGNTGFREAERMLIFPLAAGDKGVTEFTSVDLTATTGTAGNFGATLMHPLAYLEISDTALGPWRSFIDGHGTPEILPDACLAMAFWPIGTGAIELFGCFSTVEA